MGYKSFLVLKLLPFPPRCVGTKAAISKQESLSTTLSRSYIFFTLGVTCTSKSLWYSLAMGNVGTITDFDWICSINRCYRFLHERIRTYDVIKPNNLYYVAYYDTFYFEQKSTSNRYKSRFAWYWGKNTRFQDMSYKVSFFENIDV